MGAWLSYWTTKALDSAFPAALPNLTDATLGATKLISGGFPLLPRLPVLTPSNTEKFPCWHAYYRRVYGGPVAWPVDLNTFTFFYWDSPLADFPVTMLPMLSSIIMDFEPGLPWIYCEEWRGADSQKVPECHILKLGFFVVRRPRRSHFCSGRYVEVIRSRESSVEELGCAWFYHAIGSGIFIDTSPLRNIQVLDKRSSFDERNRHPWLGDANAEKSLRQNGLDLLVFLTFETAVAPPRTEIILLRPELSKDGGASAPDAAPHGEPSSDAAVNLYKGYGPKKERCVPLYKQSVLACEKWPDQPAVATRKQVYAKREAAAAKSKWCTRKAA